MGEGSLQPKEVDIDSILKDVGIFGKYQILTFVWLIFPLMMTSLHANNYIFSAADTKYRCKVPVCDDSTVDYDQPWLGNAIPPKDKCNRYEIIPNKTDEFCSEDWFDKDRQVSCDGYVFELQDTLVEELEIPCEEWKRTLVGTMHSLGTLLALPIVGYLSDRYGRKIALILSIFLEALLGVVKGLSVSYGMFLAFEVLEPTLGSGGYSSCYILALEVLVPSTRVLGGCAVNMVFGTTQVLMGAIAWALPYWRTFLIVIYAPGLIIVFWIWLIRESTRWLMTKKKYKEVIDNVKFIAKSNKKPLPTTLMTSLYYNADNASKFDVETEKTDTVTAGEYKKFFRSRIMILRVLKCSFWWITCTFSFYGLAINAVFLKGNVYQNFMYSAATEVPAHILGYFGLTYLGRKWTLFIAFLMGGLGSLSFAFIPEGSDTIGLVAYLIGKLFVTMALACVYMYTSEIFPTSLRHSLLATCSMIGRIGSIIAPQTPLLAVYMEALPSILFGSTCLISALLMLTSPETLKLRLPETIEEAERITELKIKS